MKPLVLDTSGYSRFRSGHRKALERIESAIYVFVPAVVAGELEMAFRLGSRADDNRQPFLQFLDLEFVELLKIDHEIARIYGGIISDLRRNGTPIPVNDVWIAACTVAVQGHLLTYDRDFLKIPEFEGRLVLL